MFNLFYSLSDDLQLKIMRYCIYPQLDQWQVRKSKVKDAKSEFTIRYNRHQNPHYPEYFHRVPKWIVNEILIKDNQQLYWKCSMVEIDHILFKNSPLYLKYMKRTELIEQCLANNLTIKKNWTKKALIACLLKI